VSVDSFTAIFQVAHKQAYKFAIHEGIDKAGLSYFSGRQHVRAGMNCEEFILRCAASDSNKR